MVYERSSVYTHSHVDSQYHARVAMTNSYAHNPCIINVWVRKKKIIKDERYPVTLPLGDVMGFWGVRKSSKVRAHPRAAAADARAAWPYGSGTGVLSAR